MNALVTGCTQRMISTDEVVSSTHARIANAIHRRSRPAMLPRCLCNPLKVVRFYAASTLRADVMTTSSSGASW
jgi:hypothetical protein